MIKNLFVIALLPDSVKPPNLTYTLEAIMDVHQDRYSSSYLGYAFDGALYEKNLNPNRELCPTHSLYGPNMRPFPQVPDTVLPDAVITPEGKWVPRLDDDHSWREALARAKRKYSHCIAYAMDCWADGR